MYSKASRWADLTDVDLADAQLKKIEVEGFYTDFEDTQIFQASLVDLRWFYRPHAMRFYNTHFFEEPKTA